MEIVDMIEGVKGTYISSDTNESIQCTFLEIKIFDDGFWKGSMEVNDEINFEPLMKGAIELEDGRNGDIYISTESDNGHILFVGAESDGGPK